MLNCKLELYKHGRAGPKFMAIPLWLMRTRLPSSVKLVYGALVFNGNSSGKRYTAQQTMSEMTGLGRATVERAIRTLSDLGLVTVTPRPRPKTNLYEVYQPASGEEFADEMDRIFSRGTARKNSQPAPSQELSATTL